MENTDKKSSLFSNETLDSIAMAEVYGGAQAKNCPNTYCSGAKCVDGCATYENCDCPSHCAPTCTSTPAILQPPAAQYPIGGEYRI
jgi:hypothetical protein